MTPPKSTAAAVTTAPKAFELGHFNGGRHFQDESGTDDFFYFSDIVVVDVPPVE